MLDKKQIVNQKALLAYREYLINWLKKQVKLANKKGLIVGISGGIDSALVGALAQKAFPKNSLGVVLEINSMAKDQADLDAYFQAIPLKSKHLKLALAYENLLETLKVTTQLARVNIKPRLRMIALYALAQEKDYLVLGTDNLDEWHVGYFTKHGDGACDIAPIIHLTKTEVRKMARSLNVPEAIIHKTPTADLWDNQSDEKELGITYQKVDAYLRGQQLTLEEEKRIQELHQRSAHKRNLPPKPAISFQEFELIKNKGD